MEEFKNEHREPLLWYELKKGEKSNIFSHFGTGIIRI